MTLRVGIIGCGNMGSALIEYLIARKKIEPEDVLFTNLVDQDKIAEKIGITSASSNEALVRGSDVVILAVKPQSFPELGSEIASHIEGKVVVSIMAGITTKTLSTALHTSAVCRVMPSLTLMQGSFIGGYSFHNDFPDQLRNSITSLFGDEPFLSQVDEPDIDWITALSGSGPGFVAYISDQLSKGGSQSGLDEKTRQKLVLATMMATAKLLLEQGMEPSKLVNMVASPGGTTEAGLEVLKEADVHLTGTVQAAAHRSQELAAPTSKGDDADGS